MWVKGWFTNADFRISFLAEKDCILRYIVTYPTFGARALIGGGNEQATAFFSSDPTQQEANDPWANTGIQLNIPIYAGRNYYIYPWQTASTLNGLNIQLYFDDLPAEP